MGYFTEIRKFVGHRTVIGCAASVLCVDDRGRLLLGHRSDDGMWSYPGGAVEIDEKAEDCARRELFEEAGLEAEELEFYCVNSGPQTHHVYPNGDEVYCVEIMYLCRRWKGELAPRDGEMTELRFFSPDEIDIPRVMAPNRGVVERFIAEARGGGGRKK